MEIVYDPVKRAATLETRGLDIAKAGEVFDEPTLTVEDDETMASPASLQLASWPAAWWFWLGRSGRRGVGSSA